MSPKKKQARRARKPAAPGPAEILVRVEKLETTTARLAEIAERHGDEVFPKPPPAEETPAATA
jgi:hypothetical protein